MGEKKLSKEGYGSSRAMRSRWGGRRAAAMTVRMRKLRRGR